MLLDKFFEKRNKIKTARIKRLRSTTTVQQKGTLNSQGTAEESEREDTRDELHAFRESEDTRDELHAFRESDDTRDELHAFRESEDTRDELHAFRESDDTRDELQAFCESEDTRDELHAFRESEDTRDELQAFRESEDTRDELQAFRESDDTRDELHAFHESEDTRDELHAFREVSRNELRQSETTNELWDIYWKQARERNLKRNLAELRKINPSCRTSNSITGLRILAWNSIDKSSGKLDFDEFWASQDSCNNVETESEPLSETTPKAAFAHPMHKEGKIPDKVMNPDVSSLNVGRNASGKYVTLSKRVAADTKNRRVPDICNIDDFPSPFRETAISPAANHYRCQDYSAAKLTCWTPVLAMNSRNVPGICEVIEPGNAWVENKTDMRRYEVTDPGTDENSTENHQLVKSLQLLSELSVSPVVKRELHDSRCLSSNGRASLRTSLFSRAKRKRRRRMLNVQSHAKTNESVSMSNLLCGDGAFGRSKSLGVNTILDLTDTQAEFRTASAIDALHEWTADDAGSK